MFAVVTKYGEFSSVIGEVCKRDRAGLRAAIRDIARPSEFGNECRKCSKAYIAEKWVRHMRKDGSDHPFEYNKMESSIKTEMKEVAVLY